jgi:putative peptidoglycan lipid II flippase
LSVLRHARTVSLLTLLSKVLGLFRDTFFTGWFGVGTVSDAFNLAFMVPNLFRRFLGEGALTSAFVPMLAEARERHGLEGTARLVRTVFTALTLVLGGLTALGVVVALLLPTGVWGPEFGPEKARLTFQLTAFLLPFMPLVCLTALASAVLNTAGRFGTPAAASVMLNLASLAGLFLLCPLFRSDEARVFGFAAVTLVGGLLGLLIQLRPLAREGLPLRPTRDLADPALARLGATMVPIVIGLAPGQVNTVLDRVIAERFIPGDGAVTQLTLASHFTFVPVGLVGFALGTVVFPELARRHARGDAAGFRSMLGQAVRFALLASLPAAAVLLAFGRPILRLLCEELPALFHVSRFGAADAAATARVLAAFAVGIPVLCVLQIVTRACYAVGAGTGAARVALVSVLVNLVLNLALARPYGAAGLAFATSVAAAVQLLLLGFVLRARLAGTAAAPVPAALGQEPSP